MTATLPLFVNKDLTADEKKWITKPPVLTTLNDCSNGIFSPVMLFYTFKIEEKYLATKIHAPTVIEVYHSGQLFVQSLEVASQVDSSVLFDYEGREISRAFGTLEDFAQNQVKHLRQCLSMLWDRFMTAVKNKIEVRGFELISLEDCFEIQRDKSLVAAKALRASLVDDY